MVEYGLFTAYLFSQVPRLTPDLTETQRRDIELRELTGHTRQIEHRENNSDPNVNINGNVNAYAQVYANANVHGHGHGHGHAQAQAQASGVFGVSDKNISPAQTQQYDPRTGKYQPSNAIPYNNTLRVPLIDATAVNASFPFGAPAAKTTAKTQKSNVNPNPSAGAGARTGSSSNDSASLQDTGAMKHDKLFGLEMGVIWCMVWLMVVYYIQNAPELTERIRKEIERNKPIPLKDYLIPLFLPLIPPALISWAQHLLDHMDKYMRGKRYRSNTVNMVIKVLKTLFSLFWTVVFVGVGVLLYVNLTVWSKTATAI